jgi:hypothetical protein
MIRATLKAAYFERREAVHEKSGVAEVELKQ